MRFLYVIFLFSFCLNSEWLYFSEQDRLQYFSNYDISEKNYNINKLVIAIEGNSRNAESIYNYILDAAELTNSHTNSLIISPWFKGNDYDGSSNCTDDNCDFIESNELFWDTDGWKQGDNSVNFGMQISSFDIMDNLIRHIVFNGFFPNLQNIIITGHSAGGQFTQRYAIGTQIEKELPNALTVSYVIANPSSYLYLDQRRPSWAGLYTLGGKYPSFGLNFSNVLFPDFIDPYIRTTTPYVERGEFSSIKSSLNSLSGPDCQCSSNEPCAYERFKYGFNFKPLDSYHYMCSENSYQSCYNKITTQEYIENFLNKNITYVLSQLDNSTSNGEEGANEDLDIKCGGNFQGPDRLSRGTYYYESLSLFGEHNHRLLIVGKIGHSASKVYKSYQGRRALFGGELPTKEYAAPYYFLQQKFDNRYLDALTSSSYSAMTKLKESDDTQKWIITKLTGDEYRIQQVANLRYLEGQNSSSNYIVSSKEYKNSSAQIWIIKPVINQNDFYTIQQKSTLRYLDADTNGNFAAKTNIFQSDNSQYWKIVIMP